MKLSNITSNQTFAGDKKHLIHFLVPYEKKLIAALLPRVPSYISTAHLTLMTLLWSSAIMASGYLAAKQHNLLWLLVFSFSIFAQYITDMLDGAVGRTRGTGLIKWASIWTTFWIMFFCPQLWWGIRSCCRLHICFCR